jgi:hypothetical protein
MGVSEKNTFLTGKLSNEVYNKNVNESSCIHHPPSTTINCLTIKRYNLSRCWWLTPVILPNYSGGRDLENCGLKPARPNSSVRPYLEKPFTKKGWWSGSKYRP